MKQLWKKIILFTMMFSLILQGTISNAHSGRTDASGGHHDYKNASGLGSYHYHHGYGPHLHPNGSCPYETTSKPNKSRQETKKYQKMLNALGYTCGTPDGILGSKSKSAIRKFQKKYNLAVTGTFNKKTKKKIKEQYTSKY
ncbi:MAG: peptidoglycan-binding protein [Roseburia sp.]|nr:peptidoglycan-binding protein [Roseburia sp.]